MPKMQIVTDAMLDRAKDIGLNAEKILASQNKVTGIFQNMGKGFSGRVPTLMTEHMLAMDGDYNSMNEILNAYKAFMEDTANNYEWTDEEMSRWAEALAQKS
ncbi:MAG: hypothetical protein IJ576_03635 [Synergistaceae bacterium]|nr:hypothetical protein [Synergistaceae bacterium]MBR1603403.1 hypothetical protein [Synergistaceae bacterium]